MGKFVKVILPIVAVILAVFSIIVKHQQQDKFVQLQKLYTQYNDLIVLNKQLKTKNYEQASLLKIEQQAQKKLQMVFPKNIKKI